MIQSFYFAVRDGSYDPETGEHDEAGLRIVLSGAYMPQDVVDFVEQQMPYYAGRLRQSPRRNTCGTMGRMNDVKTPEEIKNSLRLCSTWEKNCEECPYKPMKRALSCSAGMKRDSLAYIEQLEERINLMMIQMHGDCGCCAYVETPGYESPCSECIQSQSHPMWEFYGLPKLTKGEVQSGEAD